MVNTYSTLKSILSESKPKSICVIGKGASIDDIDVYTYAKKNNSLIININDSARILRGHITILSSAWARKPCPTIWHAYSYGDIVLMESSCAAEIDASDKWGVDTKILPLAPIPEELDIEGMEISRLAKTETFFNEDAAFLNAVKIGRICQEISDVLIPIYFFGFDFDSSISKIYSDDTIDDSGTPVQRSTNLVSQESVFRQVIDSAQYGVDLVHVGRKLYSAASFAAFPTYSTRSTRAEPVNYLNPSRTLIVAELTNNHLGDLDVLTRLVRTAAADGADLIKVQKRDVDSFYTKEQLASFYNSPFGLTLGDYRRGVELSDDMLICLDEICKEEGIDWFCSVLDYPSWKAIEKFNPKLIKVPSTISNHRTFIDKLASEYTGPIVVSTGYTGPEYVDYVLKTFSKNSALYLLHCISSYPTEATDCNLAVIREYDKHSAYGVIPGYSSHDLTDNACALAVAAGARMIEKHVKIEDADWIHFDKVALDLRTDSFANLVKSIRTAESIMGSPVKKILACEHHKYGHDIK